MTDIVVGILYLLVGILGLVVLIAGPIVAAIAWQNSRRRRFTREVAEEFDLTPDLDEGSRLSKATVSAQGVIDDMNVWVRANTPGTRIYGGPTTSMRIEKGEITVRGTKGPEGRLMSDPDTARNSDDFDAAFRWEGTPRTLSEASQRLLLEHRQQLTRAFAVFFLDDGSIISPTDTLDTKGRQASVRHRLLCLLEIGRCGVDA